MPWSLLGRLRPGQAVALPVTDEAGGQLRFFTVGPRLTPHVRHREKYVDVPVSEGRAFRFTSVQTGVLPARTLREFVEVLQRGTPGEFEGHLRRGDFSRWVAEVFGDHSLAGEMRALETAYCNGADSDAVSGIVEAIRARYDLSEPSDALQGIA